ncbi:MAG TPA: molybdopterin cofactor-binding domain-containing protein [Blastocatellia bacterium]|nr:molybdopterin cofactor-binding domain-containing protein [Blastocatellia bacterium]
MIEITSVSRRNFLGRFFSAGAFIVAARLAPTSSAHAQQAATAGDAKIWQPSVYLGIEPDGSVLIVAHRSEMGTGARTCLPMIVADELEADWGRVRVVQAVGDVKYGSQNTDGSCSVRDFYDAMRAAGAAARTTLEHAAAGKWGVPEEECHGRQHFVVHDRTGRRLSYGELVPLASTATAPNQNAVRFKTPAEFRYIGRDVPIVDLDDLVTGKGVFGIDARMPGMVYASIERPPVLGSTLKTYDDAGAKQVRGVRQVVVIEPAQPPYGFKALGGVAVVADNSWAAMKGRQGLKVEWNPSEHATYDSAAYKQSLLETARRPGQVARELGDVDAEFARGGKVIEASYYTPMLAHAPMEPPAAVAEFKDGKVVTWAATQNPQAVQDTVAKALGISRDDVTCHVTLLGGGFGRKSKPDYVAEAALLSRQVGRPVKIVWSREDDVQFDYFHSPAGLYLKAAVNEKGLPTAWLQRSVFPPIAMQNNPDEQYGGFQLSMGWTDIPYPIPNLRVENGPARAHVRIGWLRSVANIYHAFGVQSFTDELAAVAGRDRVEYLLDLIGPPRVIDFGKEGLRQGGRNNPKYPFDTARLRHVIELAARQSGWASRKPGAGRALGIAAHRSFLTYVATVVEVEVSDKGEVRIPRVDIALDAGRVINPERVKAQFEGAAVFGTSIALMGEITAAGGRIQQSNFSDYPVARINQAPLVTNVHIVNSDAAPAGVGEPGVPPMAPAICNAIFAATGKRIRELPVKKQLA